VVMVAIYARMMIARPGQGYLSWDNETLIAFGAHYPPLVHAGQWWRLGTAMFLHIGLWHLGFNLLALAQIGPTIEDLFGRGRMLAFFLITGVVANLGSEALGLQAVSAGASGAIMGLIGIAAGWGQRAGTTQGRAVRNDMLKWAAYTMIFGYAIHADNAAHAAGFAAGAVLGLAHSPFRLERGKRGTVNAVLGLLGVLGTGSLALLCLVPRSRAETVERAEPDADEYENTTVEQLPMMLALLGGDTDDGFALDGPACALLGRGEEAEALSRFRADDPANLPDAGAELRLAVICQTRAVRTAICAQLESQEWSAALDPDSSPVAERIAARCRAYPLP
jgi:membrane associated rhomboid family serine protease